MKGQTGLKDYPLRRTMPDEITTPSGVSLQDISFEMLEKGEIKGEDIRISSETLLMQADIARQSGNDHLADNFSRAAEMVRIDNDRILEIYNALRPYRSTEDELLQIADELRSDYNADRTAAFVEEAAKVLKLRKKLRGDR
ncbi:MAG: diol dehydratase small subunit [Bacillota bacterium]|nr:diol dehydratase small subunit [Bacillota bacterium]